MPTDTAPISILCVDDDATLVDLTAVSLERHDDRFAVTTATSARDGLEHLETAAIDCIVSDYDMPEMDGLEFLDAVRTDYSDLPFIVFTGMGSEEVASDAIARGASDYLQKDSGTEQYELLANRISNSVEQYRLTRQEREAERRYRSLFENSPIVIWEEDYSESKRELDAIAEEVEDLEAYFDANPEVIPRLMEQIRVIDVNENALDYYGAPSKAALIDSLDRVFTDEAFGAMKEMWLAIAAGETNYRWETVGQTLDGDRRYELIEVNVPEEYVHDFSRVYVTSMDITERKAKERELQRQKDRLEEFASVVSHDLRNPLNVATGRLELAREECESDHLDALGRSLDRMEALIDDLLALARTGDETTNLTSVDLAAVAEDCWRNTQTAGATLVIETERVIRADERRLQQLLENLVRNAVEHGGEDVTVTIGDVDGGFYVADDGPGIPIADRERVFDRGFSTADGGTGFGLHIVSQIAAAHDWNLRVIESASGGTQFDITDVAVDTS